MPALNPTEAPVFQPPPLKMVSLGCDFPPSAPHSTETIVHIQQLPLPLPGVSSQKDGENMIKWKKRNAKKLDRQNKKLRKELNEMQEKLEAEKKKQ